MQNVAFRNIQLFLTENCANFGKTESVAQRTTSFFTCENYANLQERTTIPTKLLYVTYLTPGVWISKTQTIIVRKY